jgi:uncharacterized protein (DUF1778 family)
MGRYDSTYAGERRTAFLGVKLTPSERDELDTAAATQGASASDFARELLFRRAAAVVAATRRNPEAHALFSALVAAGRELNAIGNNLNQIARHLNSSGDLRDWGELREALAIYTKATERIIEAFERVLAL